MTTIENNRDDLVGTVVTVKPKHRRRTFRLEVKTITTFDWTDDVFLDGLLPSTKYPGDYRGRGSAWASEIVA